MQIPYNPNADYSSLKESADGKKQIIKCFYEENIGMRQFSKNHNLPISSVCRWKKIYDQMIQHGVDNMHSGAGRPRKIDAEGEKILEDIIQKTARSSLNMKKRDILSQCRGAAIAAAIATTKRRRTFWTQEIKLCQKTIKNYCKRVQRSNGSSNESVSSSDGSATDQESTHSQSPQSTNDPLNTRPIEFIQAVDALLHAGSLV